MTYPYGEAGGRELLRVAFVQTVLSHERGEVLQAVGVTLSPSHVQQVVPILVSDALQVLRREVRLQTQTVRSHQHIMKQRIDVVDIYTCESHSGI